MPIAARIGDWHICSMVEPGPVPHVGGKILTGAPTVLIGGSPASRVTDIALCVGPPAEIIQGAATVWIGGEGKMAARMGDPTDHGSTIASGCPTVRIGDTAQGAALRRAGAPLVNRC